MKAMRDAIEIPFRFAGAQTAFEGLFYIGDVAAPHEVLVGMLTQRRYSITARPRYLALEWPVKGCDSKQPAVEGVICGLEEMALYEGRDDILAFYKKAQAPAGNPKQAPAGAVAEQVQPNRDARRGRPHGPTRAPQQK